MAGLLYYLPTEKAALTPEQIEDAGLGYALPRKCPQPMRSVQGGPDQQQGVIIAVEGSISGGLIGYYPDRQTWRRLPSGAAWVGYYTDQPPTPAELVRDKQLPGHLVTLGDDQDYEIPVARGFSDDEENVGGYQALPSISTLDDEGNWTPGGVVAKHAELWEVAQRWWDSFVGAAAEDQQPTETGGLRVEFDFAGLNDAALTALATNYRLGKAEVALLGLFDQEIVREILLAVIDWPTIENWLKKKEANSRTAAGSATDAGPPADTGPTDPASQTCGP